MQHFYWSLIFCRYFENYKNVGEFLDLDLLDHLGDTILMNERLMFLGELKTFFVRLAWWVGAWWIMAASVYTENLNVISYVICLFREYILFIICLLFTVCTRSAKYREYHQLFEKGEVVAAGKLLVSLLTSNTVPKK